MMPKGANVLQFPAQSSNIQVRRAPLADGDKGIALTIWVMRRLVEGIEGACSPQIRQLALQITQGLDAHDKAGQIAAILDWVKQNIDFRGEYKETIQSPMVTAFKLKGGDCDDHSTLIAALLKSLGFKTRFNTVASDSADPRQFTHVFAEVLDPATRQWTALDSTVQESYPGWRPTRVYREQDWKPMGDFALDNGTGLPIVQSSDPSNFDVLAQDVFAPIAQGLANRISYGTNSALIGTQVGSSLSPGSTGVIWLVLGFGMLWLITRR